MPSSYTPNLRLEQQFTGENINIWGVLLNAVLARIDSSIAGLTTVALTGNYTLSVANGVDDEARSGAIKTTGTGTFTVTIPSVSKVYVWINSCTGPVTITTGAGATVTLASGEKTFVLCDASNVMRVINQDMGGAKLVNVGAPSVRSDAANKGYVDDTAWAVSSGQLPGQIGADGEWLQTRANVAGWSAIYTANVADYASDQDARAAVINANITAISNTVSNTISNTLPPLANAAQALETIQTLAIANVGVANSGVLTIDLSQGTAFSVTLNKNISNVAYINPPPAGVRKTWTLTLIGNTTANTVTWTHNANTWAGNVVHSGGTAPVINTTVGVNTTLNQWTDDGGVKVRSVKGSET